MADFEQEYKKLNQAQKEAVDLIHGPLMVVAGPGTGKTQLLSMRVANILRQTDVLPRNILCLTFTESAASAMRERLLGLIGVDAHKVAIHTFHSFGVEVINQYPEYFYRGAEFKPSDEVLQVEVLQSILAKLPHDNPLSATMNDRFVYLRSINQSIGYLKRAGLDPDDLRRILTSNNQTIAAAEPVLQKAFRVARLSKSHLPKIQAAAATLKGDTAALPEPFRPLIEVLKSSLELALSEAAETNSTKPLTAWKNSWLEKDKQGEYIFKDRGRNARLEALADVYDEYQAQLQTRSRYDFSDMVLQVLDAIGEHQELRYALQEQFQFILVDEFQDTNDGQLRLLYLLADNPVHEGKPDVMVVGDDDQAIYKFQGAEVNNIINFRQRYPGLNIITLRQNYRSTQDILDLARNVITQGELRLETTLEDIDKSLLTANPDQTGQSVFKQYETEEHEYTWIAAEIKHLINTGVEPQDIAVIGRQHSHLEALMPHLRNQDIPVTYERRQNVLDYYHIAQLIDMAYTVQYLADSDQESANEYLSRILSYPFWGLDPTSLWRLSYQAYEQKRLWLEVMLDSKGEFEQIARFITECAALAASEPLEYVLDRLIGSINSKGFISPYRDYYFSPDRFDSNRGEYTAFLSALNLLRSKLKSYRHTDAVYLRDFIDFIEVHRTNDMPIVDETPFTLSDNAVTVTTAHKAKGQEYQVVFVMNAQESVWAGAGGRQQIRFPENLPITPPGDAFDDQLRLFYVGLTRAKRSLYVIGHKYKGNGKLSLLVPFIDHELFAAGHSEPRDTPAMLERSWQSYHPLKSDDAAAVLKPILSAYQLNVTHLLKFLDVVRGGPRAFLLESLMRFPKAPAASAAYGTAVHETIGELYQLLKQQEALDPERGVDIFTLKLTKQRLREEDHSKYLRRGQQELRRYLSERLSAFSATDLIEIDFKRQGVVIGTAKLTGRIDKVVLDKTKKQGVVSDFKTGRPLTSWQRRSGNDALKAWRYNNQLIFYKLLIENSRTWSDYKVERGVLEFVQPLKDEVVLLEAEMAPSEVERLELLIQAVWSCIQNLEFPDVSGYSNDIHGIRQFEDDLLKQAASVSI